MKKYQITENNIIYNIKEYNNGDKFWSLNDQFYREDGPACEYSNGNKYWFKNGQCHRDDGPAVEWANGYKEYWYNGHQLTNISSDKELKRYIKLLSIS